MNEKQYQNSTDTFENKTNTVQTFAAGGSGENNTAQTYAAGRSGETNTARTYATGGSGENNTARTYATGGSGETNTARTYATGGSGETNTARTYATGRSGENGQDNCVKKMKAACKDLCNRFMSARLGISYDISTRVMDGEGQGTSQGQQSNNVMIKQGEMELRVTDLAIGAVVTCAFMSVMCAVKRMCCCKGKRKC